MAEYHDREIAYHRAMAESHRRHAADAAMRGHTSAVANHTQGHQWHTEQANKREEWNEEAENNVLPRDYYDNQSRYEDPENENYQYDY